MTSRGRPHDQSDEPTGPTRPEQSDPVDLSAPITRGQQVRRVANLVNFTTPLGLVVARIGGATVSRGPAGCLLATGYRYDFPKAGAFTVGNVVLTKKSLERLLSKPRLLRHETRHSTQYACLGLSFLPAYGVAAVWSLARTGDPASRNVFERLAGLDDGDYVERPVRPLRRRRRAAVQPAV